MQSTNIPSKIPLPFAYAAGTGYIEPIPTDSQIGITNGRASLHDGFPPLTFSPISSGGVPPLGADFNGILNEITTIQQWQEAGGFFPYDSVFSTIVNGYPKGAVLQSASFNGFWISTVENNTTNPDAGGAGWVSTAFEGLSSVAMSGTSITLTAIQSAYPIVVITGTLTANSTVIVPNKIGEWIFSNQTTGAYTLTVITSAGTGVNITQGSSQYCWSDATNIYYANASSVTSFNTRTGAITLNSTDVTSALGFTPYNATNPSNYTSNNLGLSAQTWTNVTSSRVAGTVYTNSTGNPIFVYISIHLGGQNGASQANVFINGTQVADMYHFESNSAFSTSFTTSFIVPNGSTYEITLQNLNTYSSSSIDYWWELR